jgi:hypothetical protein
MSSLVIFLIVSAISIGVVSVGIFIRNLSN